MNDVIIIGAGPAGLAAAVQLTRYGIIPLIIEREAVGGLLKNARLVENYPGFPGGISGKELVGLFEKQAQEASIVVTFDEVTELDFEGEMFSAVARKSAHHCRIAVVATGTKPRKFTDFEIPQGLENRVYYEAFPLLHEKRKAVAVVGRGDAAFDYALNLGQRNDVLILNRGATLRCLPLLRERAAANPRIKYLKETSISRLEPDAQNGMRLECITPEGAQSFNVHYLIGAMGRDPQLDFLSECLKAQMDELENKDRLYLIGDVRRGIFRQTAIAAGDGILAAMRIGMDQKEKPS